jgi:hypothetical protein
MENGIVTIINVKKAYLVKALSGQMMDVVLIMKIGIQKCINVN